MIKQEKGITLLALIITIIVLVILAAITISAAYNSGIIRNAEDGAKQYAKQAVEENKIVDETTNYIDSVATNIKSLLGKNEENEDKSMVASVVSSSGVTKCSSLNEAVQEASKESSPVYIINDCEVNEELTIPANVSVIVGNGKDNSYEPENKVKTFGNLTINSTVTVER